MNRLPPQGESQNELRLNWYHISPGKSGATLGPTFDAVLVLVVIGNHWEVHDGSNVIAEGTADNPRDCQRLAETYAFDAYDLLYPQHWVAFHYRPGKLVWLIQTALQKAPLDAYPEFLLN